MSGAKYPKYLNELCYGINLSEHKLLDEINLNWIIIAYKMSKDKSNFFKSGFNRLAGNEKLQNQIINGLNSNEIKNSWQNGIEKYKTMRSKYLLYD
jgi:uncharacterized protein YbbC (DUF1343 family)